MGFGIRIAPGVRISASKRGLRAGLGPRIARVHVGTGRVGVSTGLGPVTYYTGVGGKRRKRPSRGRQQPVARQPRASLAQLERQARQAQRDQEIAQLLQLERSLVTLHLEEFPSATRSEIPPPTPVDSKEVARELRRDAMAGIPWRQRNQRRNAKRLAAARLPQAIADEAARRQQNHDDRQAEADALYAKLVGNDPITVLSALEAAFEDNQSAAAGVDCSGATASVVILFGSPDSIPDRKPATTPTGKPTLHKRSKTEREDLYLAALGSTVLATVKEGFACCPGLEQILVLVARRNPTALTVADGLEAIYIGGFRRMRIVGLDWRNVSPVHELLITPGAKINRRGSTGQVARLHVANDPELESVMRTLATSLDSSHTSGRPLHEEVQLAFGDSEAGPDAKAGSHSELAQSDQGLPDGSASPPGETERVTDGKLKLDMTKRPIPLDRVLTLEEVKGYRLPTHEEALRRAVSPDGYYVSNGRAWVLIPHCPSCGTSMSLLLASLLDPIGVYQTWLCPTCDTWDSNTEDEPELQGAKEARLASEQEAEDRAISDAQSGVNSVVSQDGQWAWTGEVWVPRFTMKCPSCRHEMRLFNMPRKGSAGTGYTWKCSNPKCLGFGMTTDTDPTLKMVL